MAVKLNASGTTQTTFQIGKAGPLIKNSSGTIQIRNTADNAYVALEAANSPTTDNQVATKSYVDSVATGLNFKASVRMATTANLDLVGLENIDGVSTNALDRVLVKNQSDATENGIYDVTISSWIRSADADTSAEVVPGMSVFVDEGTVNGSTGWTLSEPSVDITLGADDLVFVQFSDTGNSTAGNGLVKVAQEFAVDGDEVTITATGGGGTEVAVLSSGTANEVLRSAGSGDATWGALAISSDDAITGNLDTDHGGTNADLSAIAVDAIIKQNAGQTAFEALNPGSNNQFLVSDGTNISYDYVAQLRDGSGDLVFQAATSSAQDNFLFGQAVAAGSDPIFGVSGVDTNADLILLPKGTGVITVFGTTNYEDNVTLDDDIPNKKYVDDNLLLADTIIDGDTFFTAGDSASTNGTADNTLEFQAGGSLVAQLDTSVFNIDVAGTFDAASGTTLAVTGADASTDTLVILASNASFTGDVLQIGANRSQTTAFDLIVARSDVDGSPDDEFRVNGQGDVSSDGGTAMSTPADYADYFEWEDGNPNNEDRVGYSVVSTADGLVRIAVEDETPIGIASGNPTVAGNSAWNRWIDKYQRDDFNRHVYNEAGERILSPQFDPNLTYVPRSERQEWDAIGLVGRLGLRKGQVTNPNWIKLRDISANVEEWLVK